MTGIPGVGVRSVYLDQFAYVRLAKAGLGRGSSSDADTERRLLQHAMTGDVRFPLSTVHYLETWRQANPTRRQDLTAEMVRLSRLVTIAPTRTILRHEICDALHQVFGIPAPVDPSPVWGRGAVHALGSAAGEFPSDGVSIPQAEMVEMLLLAGASGDAARYAGEERERHRLQQRFADQHSTIAHQLAGLRSTPIRRRHVLQAQAFAELENDLLPALIGADIPPARLESLGANGREQFLQAIPTMWVFMELRRVRLPTLARHSCRTTCMTCGLCRQLSSTATSLSPIRHGVMQSAVPIWRPGSTPS